MKRILNRSLSLLLALVLLALPALPADAEDAEGSVAVTGVTLNKTTLTLQVGASETLTAMVAPANATDKTVTWTSSDPSFVSVEDGKVTALQLKSTPVNVKVAVVTRDKAYTAVCEVTVEPVPVESVTIKSEDKEIISNQSLELKVGETKTLTAAIVPANATFQNVTWTSSAPEYVSVSGGTITALKVTTNDVTITATSTDNNLATATCTVKVNPVPVEGISLNEEEIILHRSSRATLTAIFDPKNATDKTVTWTMEQKPNVTGNTVIEFSEPTGKLTDQITGRVTAVSAGEATVTVTTEDGSKTASCKILVPEVAVSGISLDQTRMTVSSGGSGTLTAVISPLNASIKDITWSWREEDERYVRVLKDGKIARASDGLTGDTLKFSTVSGLSGTQTVRFTATSRDGGYKAYCDVSIVEPVHVSGIELSETDLPLVKDQASVTLSATLSPTGAINKNVWWTVAETPVTAGQTVISLTTLSGENNGKTTTADPGVVRITPLNPGTAVITATSEDNATVYATCTVTVSATDIPPTSIGLDESELKLNIGQSRTLTATVYPASATERKVIWGAGKVVNGKEIVDPQTGGTIVAILDENGSTVVTVDQSGLVTAVSPGEARVAAGVGDKVTAICVTTVSGITLKPNRASIPIGGNTSITRTIFGDAKDVAEWEWTSDDTNVARVNSATGQVTGVGEGTVIVTCRGGGFTQSCPIVITESGAERISGSLTNGRMNFSTLVTKLRESCSDMTFGGTLSYITNLSVPTSEGTLYDHYVAEPDTGAGISTAQIYYDTTTGNRPKISDVYLVPKPDFTGDEIIISYTGYTDKANVYSGTIAVPVSSTVSADSALSYSSSEGEAVHFLAEDFSSYCRTVNGRDFSYVTFILPAQRYGTLQFNDLGGGLYERPAAADTRYYRNQSPSVDNIYCVPRSDYAGTFYVDFQGVDVSGAAFSGRVRVIVSGESQDGPTDIGYTVASGERVYFNVSDFTQSAYNANRATLNYIYFPSLPYSSRGTLYYNGSTRVTTDTHYYSTASGSRRTIDGLSFVARSNYTGNFTLPFRGVDTYGEIFYGTLRITVTSGSTPALYYEIAQGQRLWLNTDDFSNASYSATDRELNYIYFPSLPSPSRGTLYHLESEAASGTYYYRTYTNWRRLIEDLSFVPASSFTGVVVIPYNGVNSNGRGFSGSITIAVNPTATPTTPATPVTDPNASLTYYSNSAAVQLRPADFTAAAANKLDYALSTVRFTQPDVSMGRLCVDYMSPTQYSLVDGTRNYPVGALSSISFQPKGGFRGTVYIPYTGTDIRGKSYSGMVTIKVDPPTVSGYFDDMTWHTWAVPAVDFLRTYGVVNGTDYRTYSPAAETRRGDFVLMLSRAFTFPYSGTESFTDVDPYSYYAAAIAAAKSTGVAAGNPDGSFSPDAGITRQDAAVFLHRVMSRAGTMPVGSYADLAPFWDRDEVADYAVDAMGSLVRLGVFQGDDTGALHPTYTLTRAEMANIFYKSIT